MHHSPRGIHGVAGLTRASRYGKVDDYANRVVQELCPLAQVEAKTALDRREKIASGDGVDGIFIEPADLCAILGHSGNSGHLAVASAIHAALARLMTIDVPSGILSLDDEFTRRCIAFGTVFTAVGVDLDLLNRAAQKFRRDFKRWPVWPTGGRGPGQASRKARSK